MFCSSAGFFRDSFDLFLGAKKRLLGFSACKFMCVAVAFPWFLFWFFILRVLFSEDSSEILSRFSIDFQAVSVLYRWSDSRVRYLQCSRWILKGSFFFQGFSPLLWIISSMISLQFSVFAGFFSRFLRIFFRNVVWFFSFDFISSFFNSLSDHFRILQDFWIAQRDSLDSFWKKKDPSGLLSMTWVDSYLSLWRCFSIGEW